MNERDMDLIRLLLLSINGNTNAECILNLQPRDKVRLHMEMLENSVLLTQHEKTPVGRYIPTTTRHADIFLTKVADPSVWEEIRNDKTSDLNDIYFKLQEETKAASNTDLQSKR